MAEQPTFKLVLGMLLENLLHFFKEKQYTKFQSENYKKTNEKTETQKEKRNMEL